MGIRLFVAVYPPSAVVEHLSARVGDLAVGRAARSGVNARLAAAGQWHLTLTFLGEVPDEQVPTAVSAVREAVGRWQLRHEPAPLRLAGGGRFGRGRFTILWVGVDGDAAGMVALAAAIQQALRTARLPYDRKPLRSHLTLARPGDRVDITDDLVALAAYVGPWWIPDQIVLVRSTLGPRPRYEQVAVIALSAPA